jgi:septum formation protein
MIDEKNKMKINLASISPRRKQLLEQIGIDFDLVDIEIDETWDGHEPAKLHVKRMALEKARAAKLKIQNNLPILAADTCVVIDSAILG